MNHLFISSNSNKDEHIESMSHTQFDQDYNNSNTQPKYMQGANFKHFSKNISKTIKYVGCDKPEH